MSFAANFSSMSTLSPIKPAKMITWQAALPSSSDKAVRLYETRHNQPPCKQPAAPTASHRWIDPVCSRGFLAGGQELLTKGVEGILIDEAVEKLLVQCLRGDVL